MTTITLEVPDYLATRIESLREQLPSLLATVFGTSSFQSTQAAMNEHFELQGERIIGLTPTGRATVELLKLNDEARLIDRRALIAAKRYPPQWL